jgi:hypothetical protein
MTKLFDLGDTIHGEPLSPVIDDDLFFTCEECGQIVDRRDLDQVIWREMPITSPWKRMSEVRPAARCKIPSCHRDQLVPVSLSHLIVCDEGPDDIAHDAVRLGRRAGYGVRTGDRQLPTPLTT